MDFDIDWYSELTLSQLTLKRTSDNAQETCRIAPEFEPIFSYIDSLKYDENPNYNKLVFMYEKILLNKYAVPSPNKLEWVRNYRPVSRLRRNETM
jgi:hypothetical protein